jgi:ectoine hydroxylase-related dioxygenase (phytanoyl-CoA dioxygenase family)
MICTVQTTDDNWLELVQEAIEVYGVCLVGNAIDENMLDELRPALYKVRDQLSRDLGEKLVTAQKSGDNSIRFMMKYNEIFLGILENPIIRDIVLNVLSSHAILKFQNGLIQAPAGVVEADQIADQRNFHMNSRQMHKGTLTSLDVGFGIDAYCEDTVALHVCPGSHQRGPVPRQLLESTAEPVSCDAGTIIVFDSTLWHYESNNRGQDDHLSIFHQFTMPYIKQHIDYVRTLGADRVVGLSPVLQQFLGYYTRVPASLEEFYVPAEERLYKAGQP